MTDSINDWDEGSYEFFDDSKQPVRLDRITRKDADAVLAAMRRGIADDPVTVSASLLWAKIAGKE